MTSGADDVDLGREVYDDFCVSCHGCDMVRPRWRDLRSPKDDFGRFRKAVLEGKPPAMPAWRDKISDDDVKLLWAYVRSGGARHYREREGWLDPQMDGEGAIP